MTAVEWLFENLNIYVLSEDMKAEIKIFEQAKEMERNQLIDFFKFFRDNGENYIGLTIEQFVELYLNQSK